MSSKIEWTGDTLNVTSGCTKKSPGCKNCYAIPMHRRLTAMGTPGYEKPFSEIVLRPERIDIPRRKKKATTYFVNSMSDLFHGNVRHSYIRQVLQMMRETPQHTYQVLTKRHQSMNKFFFDLDDLHREPVPENLWMGVSVENDDYVERIDWLRQSRGLHIRFLSIEPLLGCLGDIDLEGIDWVICGGESGLKARPMPIDWARNIRDQCVEQGVPFFFKQWGSYGSDGVKRSKKLNGRELDGRTWNQMPK